MSREPAAPSLTERIRKLEAEVRALRSQNRVSHAGITSGGITISGAGNLEVLNDDGAAMLQVGAIPRFLADGVTPQRGIVFRRQDDNTVAFELSDNNTTTTFRQFWAFRDRHNNLLATEDADSGTGLARPYIGSASGLAPTDVTKWPETSSVTFTDLLSGWHFMQHPRYRMWLQAVASNGTTAGEIQVLVDSAVSLAPQTVAAGQFQNLVFDRTLPDFAHAEPARIHVQGRVTSGTGTLRAQVFGLYGVESGFVFS